MQQYCDCTADVVKRRTLLFNFAPIQLFDFFNDDQIIPGQQEAVARNIESWPGVSGLVASVAGEVGWQTADPRPLLDGGEEEHSEQIPDPGVEPEPQPGQQRRVLTQHLALTQRLREYLAFLVLRNILLEMELNKIIPKLNASMQLFEENFSKKRGLLLC